MQAPPIQVHLGECYHVTLVSTVGNDCRHLVRFIVGRGGLFLSFFSRPALTLRLTLHWYRVYYCMTIRSSSSSSLSSSSTFSILNCCYHHDQHDCPQHRVCRSVPGACHYATHLSDNPSYAVCYTDPYPSNVPCDFQTGTPKTQLIAHDKEVYDIAFAR